MGHSFLIGMATGYSEVEIGYGEYIGYHHDSKMLFGAASSNNGTAVKYGNESTKSDPSGGVAAGGGAK
jgi:hypothetical protein